MGDLRILAAMFQAFLRDVPARVELLSLHVAQGRLGAVAEEAHAIKGAAGAVTAARLTEVAAALEIAGRDGNLEAARAGINGLQSEAASCVSCIEALCKDLQAP